jgi:hypothetical protein
VEKRRDQQERQGKNLIRSVDLKLERADYQVRSLLDQISAWQSRSYIEYRHEQFHDRTAFRVIFEAFSEPPPKDHWGLLIGECCHNLRSALDNLAFALARLKCDPPDKPKDIAFPIFEDESKFENSSRKGLKQMQPDAASLIQRLQPFQVSRPGASLTPNTERLVLLRELNNADKHSVPKVIVFPIIETRHAVTIKFSSHDDLQANEPAAMIAHHDPLEPGSVLLEYRSKRGIEPIDSIPQVTFLVAMETMHKPEPVEKTLNELNDCTASVVEKFRGFFK